ncbi:MAG: hypothetical protein WCI97_09480 [Bacteroidota bacterium]
MSGTKMQQAINGMTEADSAELMKFFSSISEKDFTLKETNVSTRVFQHWKNQGLIPFTDANPEESDKKREWVRLKFSEFLWIKTVDTLRKFGYPFESIKKAKEDLFKGNVFDMADSIQQNDPELSKRMVEFFVKDNHSKEIKEELTELFKSRENIKLLKKLFEKSNNLWNLLIFNAKECKGTEMGIAFLEDGTAIPLMWNMLLNFDGWGISNVEIFNAVIRTPHVYISLTKYILEFIADEERNDYLLKFSLLSNDEYDLLNKVRSKEYKKITINYDKGTETKVIKTEKKKKVSKENISDFLKNVLLDQHRTTTIKATRNGDLIINTEKTKKL